MAHTNEYKKTVLAVFEDPDETKHAAEHLIHKGVKIRDIYSPFPIHGIDKVLGVKPTRISTVAFFYGLTGTTSALLMIWYMNIKDWPMNIGGKPSFSLLQNLPAFIPVTFELTVLFAAHLMIFTFFYRSRLGPGVASRNPDPRSTDDKFVVEIVVDDNKRLNEEELRSLLKETGPSEINNSQLKYKD